jgi:hypothetical protein
MARLLSDESHAGRVVGGAVMRAKALQAAREAEEKATRKKEAGVGKVENPPNSPRTTPTPEKNPRK